MARNMQYSGILLIAPAGISISPQTDPQEPGWGLSHDGADVFQIFTRFALYLEDGKDVSYYGRMADLEGMLGKDFFRVHRAYIVNMRYVKAYDWQMVNVGGSDLPVARGKYQQLVKAYMSYHTRQEGM